MSILKKIVFIFVACCFLSFFCVCFLGKKVNPILLNYLNLEVERITSNIIDSSVNDVLAKEQSDELFVITKNGNNEIEMIDYDTQKVNLLLKRVNENIYSKLKKLEEGNIKDFSLSSPIEGSNFRGVESGLVCEIPIGSLTGNGFLNNLGPVVPIKMSFLGQVSSTLKTKVTSYGINNLYLELYIQVEVKERISLPRSSKDVTISITAPLSIKIVSGIVPDYYGGILDKSSQTSFFPEIA